MTLIYRFAYRQLHSASQRMVKVDDALYLGETGLCFGLFGGEQRLLRCQHLQIVRRRVAHQQFRFSHGLPQDRYLTAGNLDLLPCRLPCRQRIVHLLARIEQ